MLLFPATRLLAFPWNRALLLGLAALAGVLSPATPAAAQLSATSLIGDSVSAPDSPRYSDIGEAIKRFNNRDILGAQQFLEAAKRKDSKLPPIGVMFAKMYALSGNSSAVRSALEQSINDEADDPEPYLLLAESTLQNGQTIEADALFEKSVKLISSYTANAKRKRSLTIRAYRGRAAVAERRSNWSAAEADIRVWLEADPDDASAHSRLGQTLCMLDRTDEGRQEFEEAKKINEKLGKPAVSPFVMTASMYERRGLQTEAINEFKKAYKEDPRDKTTLIAFAQSLIRSGDLPTALRVLETARSVSPETFNVWLLSGVAYRMSDDPGKAEEMLFEASSLAPGSRDAFDQLAQVLASQDDPEKRQRGLQYAITNAKIYPNNTDVQVTLAWALFQSGRGREASATLSKALQSGGAALSADARVLVAKLLIASNQQDSARRLLTKAIAKDQGIFVQRAEAETLLDSLN